MHFFRNCQLEYVNSAQTFFWNFRTTCKIRYVQTTYNGVGFKNWRVAKQKLTFVTQAATNNEKKKPYLDKGWTIKQITLYGNSVEEIKKHFGDNFFVIDKKVGNGFAAAIGKSSSDGAIFLGQNKLGAAVLEFTGDEGVFQLGIIARDRATRPMLFKWTPSRITGTYIVPLAYSGKTPEQFSALLLETLEQHKVKKPALRLSKKDGIMIGGPSSDFYFKAEPVISQFSQRIDMRVGSVEAYVKFGESYAYPIWLKYLDDPTLGLPSDMGSMLLLRLMSLEALPFFDSFVMHLRRNFKTTQFRLQRRANVAKQQLLPSTPKAINHSILADAKKMHDLKAVRAGITTITKRINEASDYDKVEALVLESVWIFCEKYPSFMTKLAKILIECDPAYKNHDAITSVSQQQDQESQ